MNKVILAFILGCALGVSLTIACVRCTTWLDCVVPKVYVIEHMIGE